MGRRKITIEESYRVLELLREVLVVLEQDSRDDELEDDEGDGD